jgi:hypothetical protein
MKTNMIPKLKAKEPIEYVELEEVLRVEPLN